MKYRDFGNTGLTTSEVVFGGGAVGGLLIRSDRETMRAGVRKALNGGSCPHLQRPDNVRAHPLVVVGRVG